MNKEARTLSDHWALYQEALQAKTQDDITAVIARFSGTLGFRNFGYAEKKSRPQDNYHYYHDFKGTWSEQYKTLHLPQVEKTDPRIIQARNWYPASGWNSLGHASYDTPSDLRRIVRKRLLISGEFNVHSGITIPIRAPGIDWSFLSLVLDHREPVAAFAPMLLTASYFTNCLQTALSRISEADTPAVPQVSGRELEILRWSALGKTSWETSAILRISESTVNFHIKRAAAKFGVKGRRAAVARAIAMHLIRL